MGGLGNDSREDLSPSFIADLTHCRLVPCDENLKIRQRIIEGMSRVERCKLFEFSHRTFLRYMGKCGWRSSGWYNTNSSVTHWPDDDAIFWSKSNFKYPTSWVLEVLQEVNKSAFMLNKNLVKADAEEYNFLETFAKYSTTNIERKQSNVFCRLCLHQLAKAKREITQF